MEFPNSIKRSNHGKRSAESINSVSSVGSVATTRYNLRSQGPPNYEQFADQECPICLEDYVSPVIVNCGHSFCSGCIEKYLATRGLQTCPVCKKCLLYTLFIRSVDFTKRIQKESSFKRKSTGGGQHSPNDQHQQYQNQKQQQKKKSWSGR